MRICKFLYHQWHNSTIIFVSRQLRGTSSTRPQAPNFSPTMTTAPRRSGTCRDPLQGRGDIPGILDPVAQAAGRGVGQGCRGSQDAGGVGPAEAERMTHRPRGGADPEGSYSGSIFRPTRWLKGDLPAKRETVAGAAIFR